MPLAAAGLLSALLAAGAHGLSGDETAIAEHARVHSEEAALFLERLVDVNSGTLNRAGVCQVGEMLAPELRALGFATRWIDMPAEMDRAGHLVAERRGMRGKRLLLIGHLDTVFEADSPFQAFARTGSQARGPGVTDMKGGDVVILYALKALASAGALEGTTITVALTGDEEAPGAPLEIARRSLVEAAKASDAALDFEALVREDGREYATIARRSASSWTLRTSGKAGHSAGIFKKGAGSGAIFEMARILDDFQRELSREPHLTFNPGLAVGGSDVAYDASHLRATASGKTNMIAPTAAVSGDLRTISEEQLRRVREKMRAIVGRHLPETSAEIEFADGYPAMSPTPGNRSLLDRLNEANRDLGAPALAALDPDLRGAGDISFVAPFVSGLSGLGMPGSGAHTPEETVDLSALPLQIQRAALLIYRLTR
jgi:glutamate carboxypeptidase